MMRTVRWLSAGIALVLALTEAGAGEDSVLLGAGATFPAPLYREWVSKYQEETGVRIKYDSIGSGGGIQRLLEKQVDFGATDAYLNDEEMAEAAGHVLHIPTVIGAVGVIYNLPGHPDLKFTPDLLADMFLGKVTSWQDRRIRHANPGIEMPDLPIEIVHRSDGSGTTYIFTDYLSKISGDWETRVGRGKRVRWPVGLGCDGNPGVAQFVGRIPGAVGYVEMTYAARNGLPTAAIRNRAGNFVKPTLESCSAAARVALPRDTRIMITNTGSTDGYPISGLTWLIFYQEQNYDGRSRQQAEALAAFLQWAIHGGQAYAIPTMYSPLPPSARLRAQRVLDRLTYDGEPIFRN